MLAPTGEQFVITHSSASGTYRAVVTEVAATLRVLTHDELDLVEPFAENSRPTKGQGIILAPWAGRIAGGRWTLHGVEQQLAVTEVATGNAIHGLLRYAPYRCVEHTDSSVTLEVTIYPQLGFPCTIATSVRFELDSNGLTVTQSAVNVGGERAPWACGAHPYLAVGRLPADELTLTVPASTVFVADDRNVPVREVAVDSGEIPNADLRGGVSLAELDLDAGFGGVEHVEGIAVSTLRDATGRGTKLWQDEQFGTIVVFTPHDFLAIDGQRKVAAVEPMTAPADALNSGKGLVWLEPGDSWRGQWGISVIPAERH